jgi:hypothetical protein
MSPILSLYHSRLWSSLNGCVASVSAQRIRIVRFWRSTSGRRNERGLGSPQPAEPLEEPTYPRRKRLTRHPTTTLSDQRGLPPNAASFLLPRTSRGNAAPSAWSPAIRVGSPTQRGSHAAPARYSFRVLRESEVAAKEVRAAGGAQLLEGGESRRQARYVAHRHTAKPNRVAEHRWPRFPRLEVDGTHLAGRRKARPGIRRGQFCPCDPRRSDDHRCRPNASALAAAATG